MVINETNKMITASELMLGNILNFQTKEGVKPIIIEWKDIAMSVKYPDLFNKHNSGIPLTPEILTEWCGINKRPYKWRDGTISHDLFWFSGKRYFLHHYEETHWNLFMVYDNFPSQEIQILIRTFNYLHEFQNWHYWNSGKKHLTIKY